MKLSPQEKYYKFCPNCTAKLILKPVDNLNRLACPNCDFIFWNNPKPVVSVLISQQNKILLLQRSQKNLENYWCFPGGFINYEETPEEAIKREVKEEIDCNLSNLRLLGVYQINNDPKGINIDIIYFGIINDNIKLSDEHKQFKFFELKKLPSKIAYKHREAISDWLKINHGK